MKTAFLLMAQYDTAIIPIEKVCQDYFTHLTPEILARRISKGVIDLPMVRMDRSQKAAKGIALQDLAEYLDRRREAAAKELQQIRN